MGEPNVDFSYYFEIYKQISIVCGRLEYFLFTFMLCVEIADVHRIESSQ